MDAQLLRQTPSLDTAYPDFNDNTANLRTEQRQITGSVGPYLHFKAQCESAQHAGFKDLSVVFEDIPYVSNLRKGHAKEPFSLENLTSFKFLTIMKRSLANALPAWCSFGAMLYDDALQERITWAVGTFYRNALWGDFEIDMVSGFDVTSRITGLLWDKPNDGSLLHLGVSLLLRKSANDLEISSQPESRLTDTCYVDTSSFDVDHAVTANLELAWQRGPWLV